MNCVHKWVDMEDGSLDKFCLRCSNKAMQAVAYTPMQQNFASSTESSIQTSLREMATIHTGQNALGDVEVYRDAILAALNKPFTDQFSLKVSRCERGNYSRSRFNTRLK